MSLSPAKIRELLHKEDIEGFIEIHGAPDNEYDPEADALMAALDNSSGDISTLEVEEFLAEIWGRMFNLDEEELALRMPGIRKVAQQVAELFSHQEP